MCLSKPDIPAPPPPPQAAKTPEVANLNSNARKNRNSSVAGGSLLTGPGGLAAPATTGASTLLGQ